MSTRLTQRILNTRVLNTPVMIRCLLIVSAHYLATLGVSSCVNAELVEGRFHQNQKTRNTHESSPRKLREPKDNPEGDRAIETGTDEKPSVEDRIWLINTRHLISRADRIDLSQSTFEIYRLRSSEPYEPVTISSFFETIEERNHAVVYVHGNRFTAEEAVVRGVAIHQRVRANPIDKPMDWIIWSWPSDQNGILVQDARLKANRTDAQGIYLASILRRHAERGIRTTLIGYSFGGRVITGALHAVAGGELEGVTMEGEPQLGAPFNAGLIAPAIDSLWLGNRGYHKLATKNVDRLVLLYNRRDAVLKRYWLIDRVRGRMALGYSGPRTFAPRYDGSSLPVISYDCSDSIGVKHDEMHYYERSCHAGLQMAKLINEQPPTQ